MAIACSTSAFKTDLPTALAQIASLGFTHVDLIAIKGWDHVQAAQAVADVDAYAQTVRALLARHNLTPVAINIALGHPHQREAAVVQERLTHLEALCQFMNRLNIRVASFYPGYRADARKWDDVLADTVTSVREMLAIASRHGITLAVELHAMTPFETVEQGTRLLSALPELAVAYDPSHYAMQGIDLKATEPFIARAKHVHLRDAAPGKMQVPTGAGTVDFPWILATLKKHGYQGHISFEYLPDLPAPVADSLTALRKIVEPLIP